MQQEAGSKSASPGTILGIVGRERETNSKPPTVGRNEISDLRADTSHRERATRHYDSSTRKRVQKSRRLRCIELVRDAGEGGIPRKALARRIAHEYNVSLRTAKDDIEAVIPDPRVMDDFHGLLFWTGGTTE